MSIPIEQKVVALLFSIILLVITLQLIRRHRLREEYALIWLGASVLIFLLSIFDGVVSALAQLFAVTYAPTLILVFGLIFCLALLLAQTVMLSTQANRIRDLAQSVSLLEWQLHQVEQGRSAVTTNLDKSGSED